MEEQEIICQKILDRLFDTGKELLKELDVLIKSTPPKNGEILASISRINSERVDVIFRSSAKNGFIEKQKDFIQRLKTGSIVYRLVKQRQNGSLPKTVQLFVEDNLHLKDIVLNATTLEFPIPDELLIELLGKRLATIGSNNFLMKLEEFVHKRTLTLGSAVKNFETLGYELLIKEESTLIFQKK